MSTGVLSLVSSDESISILSANPFSDIPTSVFVPGWAKPYLMMVSPKPAARDPMDAIILDMHRTQACGWPLLCFHCEPRYVWNSPTLSIAVSGGIVVGGAAQKRMGSELLVLPYRPIVPALAANVAIYTAVWAILLGSPRLVRTVFKKRRGCCVRCGYDLSATSPGSPCPECGATTPIVRE